MAPKKPGQGPKKHKAELPPAGNILRFFGQGQEQPQVQPQAYGRGEPAAARDTPPPLAAADARSPPGGGTPGDTAGAGTRPVLHKHLAALHDMAPADSFAMSQDTDAMQVVWNDSPGSSSQQLGRSLSNLGRATGAGAAELRAIKQRLVSAAQKPRDVRRPGAAATAQQQEHSAQSGSRSGDPPAAGHTGSGSGNGNHRTPATHLRSILKRRRGRGPGGSGGRHTPASSVKFSLADSGSKGGRTGGRATSAHPGSSGKKRQAGQKRKALLELLEQVETLVQSGDGDDGSGDEGQQPQQLDGAVAGGAADVGAASDKENAGAKGNREHAVGPTGSQQLMPPPGGLHCCGNVQKPAQPAAQQPQAPEQAPQQQMPPPQQRLEHVRPAPGPAGPAAVQPQHGSGGFGDEDDADDALLAELELQLLTQVEARQAAAVAAGAARQQRLGMPPRQAAPGRAQAAPPAAQHPASQQQQQQQQQQRALPRSPYDKQPRPAAPAAAPAGLAVAAQPAGPPQPAAEAGASGLQGSESSWEDEMDAALLDQFEAAALQERASGGTSGKPAQQPQQPQPSVAAGRSPPPGAGDGVGGVARYAGGREEIHYEVKGIFPQAHEQVLLLHNKYQNRDVYAHLHAPWCDLPYRVGDTVNLLAQLDYFEGHHHCLLSMEQGMLVLHPDVLLSGTRVAGSNECPRRSYLDERIADDGHNAAAVKGTLTHNLIQTALLEGLRTDTQLARAAEGIVGDATESLYQVELSEEAAMETLRRAVPGIQRWMARFLRADPATDALLGAGYDPVTNRDVRRRVAVQEVVDIEESVWSTRFGVKGMIDISTHMVLDDPGAQQQQQQQRQQRGGWMQQGTTGAVAAPPAEAAAARQVVVAPVEIKTGKVHASHRAQVLLYLLLMEERYGRPLDWGMLWYTHTPDPQLVMKRPMELSCLMAVRNRLAAALAHGEMPALSEDKKACNWCFQSANCALAHKAACGPAATVDSFVRQSTERAGAPLDRWQLELAGKVERAAGHMTPADCEFLRKWEDLVGLEEAHATARRPEIWGLTGEERQALGRCMAGLQLAHMDEQQQLYTFRRPDGGALDCGFADGDLVLLSVDAQHVAVARGTFYTSNSHQLTVSLNRPLRAGLRWPHGPPADAAAAAASGDAAVRWRLDRDEVASTFTRLRGNLFALFRREYEQRYDPQAKQLIVGPELPHSQHAAKLRRLVVELAPPRFGAPDPTQPTPQAMNSEQHEAVRRVLTAQDYTLVLGMPGAGKTTTILSMVRALVAAGKSVLLTSYTNSAVDNILMKLAREEGGPAFLRLGRPSGVHPAVRPWLPGGERYPRKTTAEWARLADSVPVFGATCFGMSHALLKGKMFDVCIIDEAGQMVLPAALAPLLKARAFVLVGDHNQLPPLVACKEAEAGGLADSLFKRLSDAHPQAVVQLPVQYRMAADIMALPNALIYGGALRCGSDGIAQAALELPPAAAPMVAALPAWLQAALDPQRRVLFLDTAAVEGARESASGGESGSNPGEATLVLRLLRAAVAAGVRPDQLGVISPYRAQVALVGRLAQQARLEGVEALTVDKCQGRDKDCVVLSLVKSNAEDHAGKLLADWRRINVAITRAKCKLVLLGDASTLRSIDLFGRLVALVQERGWYLPLPADALAEA